MFVTKTSIFLLIQDKTGQHTYVSVANKIFHKSAYEHYIMIINEFVVRKRKVHSRTVSKHKGISFFFQI